MLRPLRLLSIGPQVTPLRILELAPHHGVVEFAREQPQMRVPARVLLVEPPDQDHGRDVRDQAGAIVPALPLAAQRLVACEDRLDVLGADRDDLALAAVEQERGTHAPTPTPPDSRCRPREHGDPYSRGYGFAIRFFPLFACFIALRVSPRRASPRCGAP